MDNLIMAKLAQAHHANKSRGPEISCAVRDKVMLSTANRQQEYMQKKDDQVAKFMPYQDGSYTILKAFPDSSKYVLILSCSMGILNSFHSSLLLPYVFNDNKLFSSQHFKCQVLLWLKIAKQNILLIVSWMNKSIDRVCSIWSSGELIDLITTNGKIVEILMI